MELFDLLYLFYLAKLTCQAYTYFVWLADPLTPPIIFSAASVAILSAIPLLHVIAHVSRAAPLSTLPVIAYICLSFVFTVLWHGPMVAELSRGILIFALTTVCDLSTLLIFISYKAWRHKQRGDPDEGQVKMRPGGPRPGRRLPERRFGDIEPHINLTGTKPSRSRESNGSGWGFEDGTWLRGRADGVRVQMRQAEINGHNPALPRTASRPSQSPLRTIANSAGEVENIRRADQGTEEYAGFGAIHASRPAVTMGDNINSLDGSQQLELWNSHILNSASAYPSMI